MNINFRIPNIGNIPGDAIAVPGYTHPHWWEFTTPRYEGDVYISALDKTRQRTGGKTAKILAATDLRFYEKTYKEDGTTPVENGLTETLDTTSYPDRAILTSLKNELGYNVYLRVMWIKGKRIMQYSGKYGELLHDGLKMDDDIRRNGEKKIKISNPAIVDGTTQMPKIADYHFKRCQNRKHVYTINFAGVRWHYSLGEWYNFQLGSPDTNEYIDSVVECYSVEIERDAKGIGRTVASFREVEENWAKTTLYTTRAIFGGSSRRKANVANRVIVAASSFSGEFDYSCDGTADDVQIQLALDYVSNTFGGGEVWLSDGIFMCSSGLIMRDNVFIKGAGPGTILKSSSSSLYPFINYNNTNAIIYDLTIDGNKNNITYTNENTTIILGSIYGAMINIGINNFKIAFSSASSAPTTYNRLISNMGKMNFVIINGCDISFSGSTNYLQCSFIYNCPNAVSCGQINNVFSGNSYFTMVFCESCNSVVSCYSSNNSNSGNSFIGFLLNTDITASNISSNTTNYFFLGFSRCLGISSCSVFSNTKTGVLSSFQYGFADCTNLTVCRVYSNTSFNRGFLDCKSCQQNKSDIGYTTCYADAGTSNAVADTSAGGYNS